MLFLETAECLDHYLEPAAESVVEMWVRGAGGLGSQESLIKNRQKLQSTSCRFCLNKFSLVLMLIYLKDSNDQYLFVSDISLHGGFY